MTDIAVVRIANPSAPRGAAPDLAWVGADDPAVLVTDLGVNRGDGIFEVAGSVDGRVHALDAHLARLAQSAAMLDLPLPNAAIVATAIRQVVDAVAPRHLGRELLVKVIYTRGQEVGDTDLSPTGWALAWPAGDHAQGRAGINVITLDRGVRSDVTRTSPWLLAGAKTLSYAANKAALREAHRRGADDVLFISSDAHALEGPSSSLIADIDGVWVTPPASEGVLAGTTQADAFAWASSQGIRTATRPILASELPGARALWLTSSGRLAAPIATLDGRPYAVDLELTGRLNAWLLARG